MNYIPDWLPLGSDVKPIETKYYAIKLKRLQTRRG